MSFSAPSSAIGKDEPRPMIEHVARLGEDILGDAPVVLLHVQRLVDVRRQLDQGMRQPRLLFLATACRARGRRRSPRRAAPVSCVVKALVEATPISGPASVGSTTCDSRAMALSGTLTTDRIVCLCALA